MGALLHVTGDNNIFKHHIGMTTTAVCEVFDSFNATPGSLSILTGFTIQGRENVQFFQSFDDKVVAFYFGKGVGSINLTFMVFCECESGKPTALEKLLERIGAVRGDQIDVVIGSIAFTGVITDFTVQAEAEPETHYIVNITMGMIDHTLPTPTINSSC